MKNSRRALQLVAATTALLIFSPLAAAVANPVLGETRDILETVPDPETARDSAPDNIAAFAAAVGADASVIWEEDRQIMQVAVSPDSTEGRILQEAEFYGVTSQIEIKMGLYTLEELDQAAASLVMTGQANWAAVTPDLSGVDVGVSPGITPSNARHAGPSIPINVVEEGEVEETSRNLDSSPFFAGADMKRTWPVQGGWGMGGFCTTAFAFWGANNNEMMTADHCEAPGDVWRAGRSSTQLGAAIGTFGRVAGADTPDIAVLRGGSYNASVYYGPNSTNAAVGIYGTHTPFVGSTVCYSGAPSGTVCGNRVTHVNLYVDYGGWARYGHMARTEQTSGLAMAGNGDSGGPVINVNSAGQALASGIISGKSHPDGRTWPCLGDPETSSRTCSIYGIYAPVTPFFQAHPSTAIMTYGAPFRDVPAGTQFATEMQWMKNASVLEDPTAAYIRPLDATTRASMAVFMYNMKGAPAQSNFNCFADVNSPTTTNRAICWAQSRGIAGGWPDGTFRPNQPVNRDAMAAFLYRLAGSPAYTPPAVSPFTDVTTSTQFYKEISWLASRGISTGWADGSFRPLQPIARDAMSAFLYRMRAQNLA